MNSIYGYYNGKSFVSENHIILPKNQRVLITILEEQKKLKAKEKPYKKYVGKLDAESTKEILEALKDCEKVDYDEW